MDPSRSLAQALGDGAFSVVVAPDGMLLPVIEAQLNAARGRVLYVAGNHSSLLGRFGRRCPEFVVRRAFTVHQLLTVIGDADGALIVIEHDGSLYEDDGTATTFVGMACRDAARTVPVIVLAAGIDASLRRLSSRADRVIALRFPAAGACPRRPGHQARLGRI